MDVARNAFKSLFSDSGLVNIESASDSAVNDMTAEERKLLKEHPYKIWKSTDGKWRTYLPPEKEGDKRKLKKCKTKADAEKAVIDYWKRQYDNTRTIDAVFAEVLEMQTMLKAVKKGTIDRHKATFAKHFKSFRNRQVKDITADDVEQFIYDQFKDGLDSKAWGRLRTVLNMIITHARKRGLTELRLNDILEDLEYKPSKLVKKPENGIKQKAYNLEEMENIVQYCKEHGRQLDLAVAFLIFTGLRVGELCTLRNSDLSDVSVRVTQALEHHKEDGHVVYGIQGTKTENGKREIFLPDSGLWLLQSLRRLNPFGEYVFEKNGKPITDASVRDKLKYICGKLNIPYRSPHKIRKSYATLLIESGMSAKMIQKQMGHADISTTMKYYYQDIGDKEEKLNALNRVEAFQRLAQ